MTNRRAVDTEAPATTRLRHEIKRLRRVANLSQPALAARIGYSRQYVSYAERVDTLPSLGLIRAIDSALEAGGALLALWREAEVERTALRGTRTATPVVDGALIGMNQASEASGSSPVLLTPAGRFFTGSTTAMFVLPATHDRGRILASPDDALTSENLRRTQRALVVAAVNNSDGPRFYGMDKRLARSHLANANDGAPLLIPHAYRLDEFTLAIAWAITNLDDALLDDDAELAAASTRLSNLYTQPQSALGLEHAAELSPVSRMWLGSDFCARHILRHADQLTDTPVFWTREQRGEEASTWLFFTHKLHYLHRVAEAIGSPATPPIRAFCIPPDAVSASWMPERILLLLAAALIESFGIHVSVCIEPEYSAVQGFVLDRTRRAIVANWINTDRIWHVDVTDHRPTLREFSDAHGWARHHSILNATTPHLRLRALAEYLRLDWAWLTGRAAELADHGASGFTRPRNRLLSLTGLERACQFLADYPREDR